MKRSIQLFMDIWCVLNVGESADCQSLVDTASVLQVVRSTTFMWNRVTVCTTNGNDSDKIVMVFRGRKLRFLLICYENDGSISYRSP